MTDKLDNVANAFERHAQTVLVLLLVALLLWVGNTTQSTAITVAEMRVEIAYMKAVIEKPPTVYLELSKRVDTLNQRLLVLENTVLKETK